MRQERQTSSQRIARRRARIFAASTALSGVWILLVVRHVSLEIGWESIGWLLPHEIALGIGGLSVPLLALWAFSSFLAGTAPEPQSTAPCAQSLEQVLSQSREVEKQTATLAELLSRLDRRVTALADGFAARSGSQGLRSGNPAGTAVGAVVVSRAPQDRAVPGPAAPELAKDPHRLETGFRALDARPQDLRRDARKSPAAQSSLQGDGQRVPGPTAGAGGSQQAPSTILSGDVLERILSGHRRWVESEGREGARADLRGARLVGLDLGNACLCSADLEAADLSHANLAGADLRHANLQSARLLGARLAGADLSQAELDHAVLIRADLQNGTLRSARLTVAKLQDADLAGAVLERANLSGAMLQKADLSGAVLRGAVLAGANLQKAVLFRADFRESVLSDANLQEADVFCADFGAADLGGVDMRGVRRLSQWQLEEASAGADGSSRLSPP